MTFVKIAHLYISCIAMPQQCTLTFVTYYQLAAHVEWLLSSARTFTGTRNMHGQSSIEFPYERSVYLMASMSYKLYAFVFVCENVKM
jgi:hypothetical protein